MKRLISVSAVFVLLLLCGCDGVKENKETQFLFNTVATVTADCDDDTMSGAFSLCRSLENTLSRTSENSDVWRINNTDGPVTVSGDTAKIIERALYYGDVSGGKFDITIYAVSSLWNFADGVVPSRDEISAALRNVDYHSIQLSGNTVCANGKKIDLGGIAKGYIADRVRDYFSDAGVKKGIINLGGNIVVFGDRDYNISIKKPFSEADSSAVVRVRNKSVVTSGVYERCIKSDGEFYHHILDPETGYGVSTDLYSATVICDSSFDADALSTVCILLGKKEAARLIESLTDTEAVFIDTDMNVTHTSGLCRDGNVLVLR